MTPETAVMPAGKVNRFEVFHHARKRDIRLYGDFEFAVRLILGRAETPDIVPARVLRDMLSREHPWVRWTVCDVDVFKAMLSWFRYKNPQYVHRFRHRKTEIGRRQTSGVDWAARSREKVSFYTISKLKDVLRKQVYPTTVTLLKQEAGVKFNQNFNAEVGDFIRWMWPNLAHLLPARRPPVR